MAEKVPLADVRVSFGPPELRILPQVNRPLTPFLSALVGSIVHSPAFETNVDPPTANLSCSPSAVGEEPTKAGPFSDMTEPQKMAIEPGAGANLDLAVGGTARSTAGAIDSISASVGRVGMRTRVRAPLPRASEGEGVPAGAVNTTITFSYNAGDRSMTQDEVNERQLALAAELRRRFGWQG